ncbi:hypothetical protein GWK47_004601 [Chionoecetes opilio]|uniref:Uncharacterized protein n=1 Tax=Chionoecetes opilio TaxID=41210 RepID=A0A8J5CYT6_CHIOP|nr:hypothetical protein GWK47_004601 [Chionoecetes opilio]
MVSVEMLNATLCFGYIFVLRSLASLKTPYFVTFCNERGPPHRSCPGASTGLNPALRDLPVPCLALSTWGAVKESGAGLCAARSISASPCHDACSVGKASGWEELLDLQTNVVKDNTACILQLSEKPQDHYPQELNAFSRLAFSKTGEESFCTTRMSPILEDLYHHFNSASNIKCAANEDGLCLVTGPKQKLMFGCTAQVAVFSQFTKARYRFADKNAMDQNTHTGLGWNTLIKTAVIVGFGPGDWGLTPWRRPGPIHLALVALSSSA